MPLCQIIWLTKSHLPASKHQFLDDTKMKISSKKLVLVGWLMASCKPDDLAKWHFLIKNLKLGSDAVCSFIPYHHE